jgi:malic enzyme
MEDKKHVMDSNLNINNKMEKKKIVIVGAGVAGICAATKLVDNGYTLESLITIIDMGKDPYNRKPEEVMTGIYGVWTLE